MGNIEVEFRACLDDSKYVEMVDYFNSNGELVLDGERITTKFESGLNDIRIRDDWKGKLLTLKVGDINYLHREEYEVKIDNSEMMEKIVLLLGLNKVHSWKTIRKKFKFNEFEVCIDKIPGFMRTLEIEKMCSEDEVEACKVEIQKLFDSLGLKIVDPDWFNAEIKKYNQKFLSGDVKV